MRQPVLVRYPQRDTDIAIHQAEVVVVARHQHGLSRVLFVTRIDEGGLMQDIGDLRVEAFRASRAAAQLADQLKATERS